jgi:Tol biopolymer transport system component
VVRADGTEPKRLAQGRGLFWSADSSKIYYRSEGELYSISVEEEGAQPERVVNLPSSSPSVSPDGTKRASVRKGRLEIVEAGTASPIAQWTGPLRIYGGKWSPRGDEFGLTGPRNPEERTGLWIYDLDKKQALKVFSGHIIEANWAADGAALAFCLGPPFYELWSVDLDPNVSTLESLGPGRTLEQHYQEMVGLHTNRITAAEDAESYLHRAMYHHYLDDKASVLADMRKYVDLCYPSEDADSRNGWLQDLIAGLCKSTPVNLGSPVNSAEAEGPGSMSGDGLRLYLHSERSGGFGKKDLYVTRRTSTGDSWGTPENLGDPINSKYNDFEPEIFDDGLTLLFVSDRPGGFGKDDIWVAKRASPDAPWKPAENLGSTINGPGLDMDPSMTADGLTLYFSSDRASGTNGCDIWVARRGSTDDLWGEPENLGMPVNSALWDACPHIAPDGLSLFFISLRLGGLGQTDLYVTTRPTVNDPWGPAVNLGPNINTHYGDSYPKISHDGQLFLFAADRSDGIGQHDIWQVALSTTPAGSPR